MEPVAEVFSSPFSSTVVNERHMNSTSYSVYDPAQNVTHWDNHVTFDHLGTLWSTPSDRRPLFPLADQESGTLWHHSLTQFIIHPSAYSAHATHSHHPSLSGDENVTEPSIPHSPPYRPFSQLHLTSVPTQRQPGSLNQILVPISLSIMGFCSFSFISPQMCYLCDRVRMVMDR